MSFTWRMSWRRSYVNERENDKEVLVLLVKVSDNEERKVLVVLVEEEKKDQMTMNQWIEEEELEVGLAD